MMANICEGIRRRLPRWAAAPPPAAHLLAAPAALLLTLCAVVPLGAMLVLTFFKTGFFGIQTDPTLDNYRRVFAEPIYLGLLFKTLRIALTVTILVLLIAYPLAYWLAKIVKRHKTLILVLIFVPYWVSYVVRSYAWLPLLGNSGLINTALMRVGFIDAPIAGLLFSEFSVMVVFVYVFLPFAIIPIYLSLGRIDDVLLSAAADLGGRTIATFRTVVLPLSMPGVAGATITVFVLTTGSYVTPRLLGGPSGVMFANLIADQFSVAFNWAAGATLAVMLCVMTIGVVVIVSQRVPITRIFLES